MVKRKTQDDFLNEVQGIHPTLDFSNAVYNGNKVPVTVICNEHGTFEKTPVALINKKRGCPHCTDGYYDSKTTDEWIIDAKSIHGDTYDYSKVQYTNATSKVIIGCKIHGDFEQIAREHLNGANCPNCVGGVKKPYQHYLNKFITVHGDRYEYDASTFVNSHTPMRIKCPTHGWFQQRPSAHINGSGCPTCAPNAPKSDQYYIDQFRHMHGNLYEYGDRDGKEWNIQCSKHGWFTQTITAHINGSRCPACVDEHRRLDIEVMKERIKDVHGDLYEYDWSTFIGTLHPMKVVCKDHGEFYPRMNGHINNATRCPTCAGKNSLSEQQIYELVENLVPGWRRSDRLIVVPYELDLIHDERKIAIEYNGLRWHSEVIGSKSRRYHLNKLEQCEKQGFRLITIFEDEWIDKPDIVKMRLMNLLGLSEKGPGARHLDIQQCSWKETSQFLNQYHLQRSGNPGGIYYAGYHNGEIVGAMMFGKARAALGSANHNYYELLRYASNGTVYAGLASKLLAQFIRDYDPETIISYADRRWSNGNLYKALGFTFIHNTAPNYWYFKNSTTERKYRYGFRKNILVEKYDGDPDLSEWENMQNMNYDRIWDCGNIKYQWNRNQV